MNEQQLASLEAPHTKQARSEPLTSKLVREWIGANNSEKLMVYDPDTQEWVSSDRMKVISHHQ